MRKWMFLGLLIFVSLFISGCDLIQNTPSDTVVTTHQVDDDLTEQLQEIYQLAIESESFDGTYEEWLETVRGPRGLPGEDGREVRFQVAEGYIQWQYTGEETWANLVELSTLTGKQGVSITDTSINDAGELIIGYSDGTETNLGIPVVLYTVIFEDYNGYAIDVQRVPYGTEVTPPDDPIREGYTFTGWDEEYTTITGDLRIQAQYTPNTYTVTFHTDGGTEISPLTEIVYGSTLTLPIPTKVGHRFQGWYLNESINAEPFFDTSQVKHNLTLYARWQDLPSFDVSFVDYDQTVIKTVTKEYQQTLGDITLPNPQREPYEFLGWSEELPKTMPAENITLYARYNSLPVISGVQDETLYIDDFFDPLEGITAYDKEDGDLSDKIVIEGSFDTATEDVYILTYRITDEDGGICELERMITVLESPLVFDTIPNKIIISDTDNIVENFKLPGEVDDVTITYESDHLEIVAFSDDTDENGFYDVLVSPPNALEGGEDTSVVITGTMSYAGETDTFTKTIRVIAQNILVFDDIADVHATAETDDQVYATGVVYSLFNGGFFITDGTGYLGVYDGGLEVEIGDEVYVKGPYAFYYTMPQINRTTEFELISSGNTPDIEPVEVTNPAYVRELDSDADRTIAGQVYTITGEIWIGGDYDNVHILDAEGDIGVQIYYNSPADSIAALEAYDGSVVTIDITYYTDHGDVVYALFDGGDADITKLTAHAELAQYYADAVCVSGPFVNGDTANLPETISGFDITWALGSGESNATLDGNAVTFSEELTEDTDITLTATVTYEGETATSHVVIPVLAYTASELVEMDKAALELDYGTVEQLDILELPGKGQWGSDIYWDVMVSGTGYALNDQGTEIVIDYTGDSWTIIVIAQIVKENIIDTKQFSIDTTVPVIDDVADVIDGEMGEVYAVQGIIYYATQNGYYVQDGTDKIFVYNGSNIDVTIGDEVIVKGELGMYNGTVQLTDPAMSSPISTDNDVTQISEGSDISKPMSGYTYTLTGTFMYGVQEDISEYDNLYLLDDSDNVITYFYYRNLEAPYDVLTELDGVKVTIDAVYYNYDEYDKTNELGVPVFVWSGEDDDISLNDTNITGLTVILDHIANRIPSTVKYETTLDFPASLYGISLTYVSSDETIIMDDGTVFLPESGEKNIAVTVKVQEGGLSKERNMIITVGENIYEDLPTELPEEEITITFWHIYGEAKAALLASQIEEFEAMYPNVTVEVISQSDYDTLREKINMGVSVDQVPTMAVGYQDHFAGYVIADAAVALDQYIESDLMYEVTNSNSSIFGENVDVGLDLSDFVESYLNENNQNESGYYYSVPYSKSAEMMAYNADVLKAHVTEIRAAGITVSDNGYLSTEVPLTYDELIALRGIIVDPSGSDPATMKTEFLINFDSSSNMFINMSRQWNAGYTNSDGDILIDNDTTRSMLNWIDGKFTNNTFVLPVEWDEKYGSTNFKYGDVAMTVGSTAGVAYNIPSDADEQDSLQFGIFNVGFAPVPQPAANEGDSFTVTIDGTDETFTGSLSAVQQGPNIGIFKDATPEERIYAWLLIKHLIAAENTAAWAMETGYMPARLSGYNSQEYSDFLEVGDAFLDADGEPGWAETDLKWNDLHASMASLVARAQNDFYQHDPAIAASSTSAGSAKVRVEAGYCLENIYIGRYDSVEESLTRFINAVIWE